VEAAGGKVISIPVVAGFSTTAILEKIRNLDSPGGTDRR
jgi:bifunctional ADP-heptose synthase (sugar kinase/adenylyltransferase)